MVTPTLLQARWSAVFLAASCRVRSAFALLTSSSKREENSHLYLQTLLVRQSVFFYPINCSYQQHWSGHSEQPSSVGFFLQHQHCWPERCGSAAAEDTPRGRWRLPHGGGSCKSKTKVIKSFQPNIRFSQYFWTLTYLFLLSLALTMAGPRVSISISAAPSLSCILHRRAQIFHYF